MALPECSSSLYHDGLRIRICLVLCKASILREGIKAKDANTYLEDPPTSKSSGHSRHY